MKAGLTTYSTTSTRPCFRDNFSSISGACSDTLTAKAHQKALSGCATNKSRMRQKLLDNCAKTDDKAAKLKKKFIQLLFRIASSVQWKEENYYQRRVTLGFAGYLRNSSLVKAVL